MAAKLRIIGYARESTRDQAVNGFNLDDQEKKIVQYAEIFYGETPYDLTIIREEGASAKSLDRPRMNDIIKMVKLKQIDIIIIHNLDRLTRQVRDLATLLELFDHYNVSLVSITEKIDTVTPMGRFFYLSNRSNSPMGVGDNIKPFYKRNDGICSSGELLPSEIPNWI